MSSNQLKHINVIYRDNNIRDQETAMYMKDLTQEELNEWSQRSNHRAMTENGYVQVKEVAS